MECDERRVKKIIKHKLYLLTQQNVMFLKYTMV